MNIYEAIQEQLEYLQTEFERVGDVASFDAAGIISKIRATVFLIIKENSYFRARQQKNKERCARWRYCGEDASICPFNNPERSCEFQKEKDVPLTLDELRTMDGEPVWISILDRPDLSRWHFIVRTNTLGLIAKDGLGQYECHPHNADQMVFSGCYYDIEHGHNYGVNWLAYRHKQ